MEISRNHPLRRLFTELVERHFFHDVHVRDPRAAGYVSNLLIEFTDAAALYRLRDAQGRRLDDVGEMLLDYVKAGKESYAIVSSFDQFEYRQEAPIFRRLSECFEFCVYGLNLVRQDLERFQREYYRRLAATLEAKNAC